MKPRNSASWTKFLITLTAVLMYVAVTNVAAQACKFSVDGDWNVQQNNKILVKLSLTQKGTDVTGLASFQGTKQGHAHVETGNVRGTFGPVQEAGRYRLQLRIKWDYGETGVYTGRPEKRYNPATRRTEKNWRMYGDLYIQQDPTNPSRRTGWHFLETLPCLS